MLKHDTKKSKTSLINNIILPIESLPVVYFSIAFDASIFLHNELETYVLVTNETEKYVA